MDSSPSYSPAFSHFRIPLPPHSECYPAIPVSDVSLETGLPRCALRGSLDPTTGIFYKATEHTRVRTAQACDKCRVRKAKCSGGHPVCERCHVRGLACHYAPERRARRWAKARTQQDAVPDRSATRSGAVPQSPPSCEGPRSTSHSPNLDADRPGRGGGNGNGQHSGGSTARTRPGRAPVADAASSSSPPNVGRVVQPDPPLFPQQMPDLRCGGHGHQLSGSRCPVLARGVLDATGESMACGRGGGEGTLEGGDGFGLGFDTPRMEENALEVCFDPCTADPPAFLESLFAPGAIGDVSRVVLADRHPTYIDPGPTGAEYPEGVEYATLFHPPPPPPPLPPASYASVPGPGPCFDTSPASTDDGPALCCTSDGESADGTRPPLLSSSSSASPVLALVSSVPPRHGAGVCAAEVWPDGARSFWGNLGPSVDMDTGL